MSSDVSCSQARALPFLGHGVGLRVPHYERALRAGLEVDWVEVISENFFAGGGRPRAVLEAVRRERPLVFHGVSLGIGSLGGLDLDYLRRLRALADEFEPAWVSDHVCWTRFEGRHAHELLPLPRTSAALDLAVENTERVQDCLARPLVLENVSSYVAYRDAEMSEWEFLAELARRSGCFLLLDLNNVLVSAHNHGHSPNDYIAGLPAEKVVQFHLANHSDRDAYKFDDHRGPVPPAVWELFEAALARFGAVSSLVEWDEDLPAWEVLVAQRAEAAERAARVLTRTATASAQQEPPPTHASSPERVGAPTHASSPERVGAPTHASSPARALPSSLERAQRLFFEALTWPSGVRDFAAARGEDTRRALANTFAGDRRLDAIARLDIYADAYFHRLLGALRELFPRLAYLAGRDTFHDFVTDYLLEHPSTAADLRHLGDRVPEFVRAHGLGGDGPLLATVAELEKALANALDAPAAASERPARPLTRAMLLETAAEDWPAIELTLAPHVALVNSEHDLERVAELCAAGKRADALALARVEHCRRYLVARREHQVYFRALDPGEAAALDRLASGARFDALCEELSQHGATAAELNEHLIRWVDDAIALAAFPSAGAEAQRG